MHLVTLASKEQDLCAETCPVRVAAMTLTSTFVLAEITEMARFWRERKHLQSEFSLKRVQPLQRENPAPLHPVF
jgi:formate hydrogenlyase subunit 6/NADH:ubiquinone oxidoreductase subunit I